MAVCFPCRWKFDHVLLVEVLEHITAPSLFLTELKRVLRPGVSGTTVPQSSHCHLPPDYARFTPIHW
jgi:ubiquinone/menaquinone biosynthesis C-methylase UbiE